MFKTLFISVIVAGVALVGLVQADPATSQPDPLPAAVKVKSGATPQPDVMAQPLRQPLLTLRPATQATPAGLPGQGGSQVSFLLTRNLPENLRVRHQLLWKQASKEQQDTWRGQYYSILGDANARLEDWVKHKKEFEQLTPEVKERYRQKAALTDQVLKSLPPAEQVQLLNMTPAERARRIMELAAELKARQSREPAKP